jgi:prepilin-type processing-associated H-X9-DG protein
MCAAPRASDKGPFNLSKPDPGQPDSSGMGAFLIARHGNSPRPPPGPWPANQRMPGGINVAFFDGHVQLVPLENLWQKWIEALSF